MSPQSEKTEPVCRRVSAEWGKLGFSDLLKIYVFIFMVFYDFIILSLLRLGACQEWESWLAQLTDEEIVVQKVIEATMRQNQVFPSHHHPQVIFDSRI